MKRYILILVGCVILYALLVSKCKKEPSVISGVVFKAVRYGTSYGECAGYCKKNLSITLAKFEYTKSSNDNSLPVKTCDSVNTAKAWQALTDKIDLVKFNNLAATIGCPDCADGGAEWIEIETSGTIHKVTFEMGNEPVEVKGYIADLRNCFNAFSNCGN